MRNRKCKHNWIIIQQYYNEGHTWRDLTKKFGVQQASIFKAIKRGDFKSSRNHSDALKLKYQNGYRRTHTEETKKKISEKRIQYLLAHPEKVPYRINHSSKRSWPEIVFENALKSSGIVGWISEYQHGLYQYDFAWIDKKIDVEVDGGTHKTEKVKKIDARRDIFSKEKGWTVLRFDAERVKKDVVGCIKELISVIERVFPKEYTTVNPTKVGMRLDYKEE